MKAVRFVNAHRMYQPGEIAGFSHADAAELIASGVAVDAAAPVAKPLEAEVDVVDPRVAAIEDAILSVDEQDFTQTGKPDVDAVNDAMPDGFDRVTAAERDAVWAGMQGAGDV